MLLIYSCIFHNINYITLIRMLLSSYKIYSDSKNIKYLIITNSHFKSKIQNIYDDLSIDGLIWEQKYTTKFDACCSRLNIFNYPNINNYKKILYLDSDIIISGNVKKIFNMNIENYLYTLHEECHRRYHCQIFSAKEYNNFNKNKSFTSGILLFNNSDIIKKLFFQIIDKINMTLDYYKFEPLYQQTKEVPFNKLFGDQPFIVYEAYNNNLINNTMLIDKAVNNPSIYNNEILVHFPCSVGNYEEKSKRMSNFFSEIIINGKTYKFQREKQPEKEIKTKRRRNNRKKIKKIINFFK